MLHLLRLSLLTGLLAFVGCAAAYRDVGPNDADGSRSNYSHSSTGLTYQLAGDQNTMYAVSLNAGIWRRNKGDQWRQLNQSSPLTTVLAIDPSNPAHLVSGDRDNNASESDGTLFDLSLSGIWESSNSGDTWQLAYSPLTWLSNPATQNSYCKNTSSQVVSTIAFTPVSTILAGTSCGIARKKAGASSFDLTATPPDVAIVTAIAVGRKDVNTTLLWAFAQLNSTGARVFLSSTDDGMNWNVIKIPPVVDGYTLPETDGEPASSRGDFHSLVAFGDSVMMIFKPNPDVSNRTGLLYFNLTSGVFSTQILGDDAHNGTGWGGRRSLSALPVAPPFTVGKGLRVFINTGQAVLEGTGVDGNGQIIWKHRATAHCADCTNPDPIHSDLWDVLPDINSTNFWVASDGGVYSMTDRSLSYSNGLTTQHIHNVVLLDSGKDGPFDGPRLDYATSDNDAWFRYGALAATPSSGWHSYAQLGDANWTEADRGNSALSLEVRDTLTAVLPDFGSSPSGTHDVGGKIVNIACNRVVAANGKQSCGVTGDTSRTWKVVQTGPGPLGYQTGTFLDVVWLATLPLQYKDGSKVVDLSAGSLATDLKGASGNVVLLRNWALGVQPDINSSKFNGWFLENGTVPTGASRIWVSLPNGQQPFQTVYYVCTCNSSPAQIFKSTGHNQPWTPVPITVTQGSNTSQLQILQPSSSDFEFPGPLFVDPINPNRLVVLTNQGVALSTTGGSSWTLDVPLTALVTASNLYPFANDFPSGNGKNVVLASRGLNYMYVSDVAFGWNDDQLAVASPFTGIFYRPASGQPWKNATIALPTPLPTVSSIVFWTTELYVATEGRSLLETFHLPSSPIATYFEFTGGRFLRAPASIHLLRSDASPVAGASVTLTTVSSSGIMKVTTFTTDTNGLLSTTSVINSGDRVFLYYAGTDSIAPATTARHF
jgi:hypothetical protein